MEPGRLAVMGCGGQRLSGQSSGPPGIAWEPEPLPLGTKGRKLPSGTKVFLDMTHGHSFSEMKAAENTGYLSEPEGKGYKIL